MAKDKERPEKPRLDNPKWPPTPVKKSDHINEERKKGEGKPPKRK